MTETKSMSTEVKDNKILAIVAMNISVLCNTGMAAMYRIIAREGFHPADYNLYRNAISFSFACIWIVCIQRNPFKEFPYESKFLLLFRIIIGQINFVIIHIAAIYAPLSLAMVCW